MSRRLEIELTSRREDGTWTWRAAGARHPKGDVSADLLPESADVGTVLKAEADVGLDGVEIVTVFAPRTREQPDDRLELITRKPASLVTATLAGKRGRPRPDDHGDRRRRDAKRDNGRDPHRSSRDAEDGSRGARTRDKRRDGSDRRSGRDGRDYGGSRRHEEQDERDGSADSRKTRRDRDDRPAVRSKRDRDQRPRTGKDSGSNDRDRRDPRDRRDRDDRQGRPLHRSPALRAKKVHRQAALAALPEEQHPLAREVLRGGVPGVRRSIERMNAKANAAGLPQIKAEPLIALAEALLPAMKAAEWHDRADAALAGIAEIDLRDIRSVVAAAERSARSDETRALAESLRAGLAHRLEMDHRKWLDELARTIHEGRTVRALRLSSRPPKAGTPLPPDMAERLAGMASADLDSDTDPKRWAVLVDSIAVSPVRTQVVPAGVPAKPTDELLGTIRRLADRVPQVAAPFNLETTAPRAARRPPPPPAIPNTAPPEPTAGTGTDTTDTAETSTPEPSNHEDAPIEDLPSGTVPQSQDDDPEGDR